MPSSPLTVAMSDDAQIGQPSRNLQDSDSRTEAIAVRRQWMRLMGFDEGEIEEHCGQDAAIVLEEEIAQLRAMERVKKLNEQQNHAS
jgi:hypothetical protein